ncbi:unnamed protein product [Paramecium sonneborni]|uniref:Uncharacterized protein n=1 Tax=Paramecium sonneborni TaxID=65129 RepID=A0A8S1RNU0_9CILI|nr:unnamed protein product [Paramecium sonneborni]
MGIQLKQFNFSINRLRENLQREHKRQKEKQLDY